MSAVRDRLRNAPLPGEAEAAARSWPVVEAALAERAGAGPGRRGSSPRRLALRLVVVTVLVALALAAALSPAGAAVGDWIGDRFGDGHERSTPAFAALPPGGSVLAISRSGAYAIDADGNTQGLGAFSEAGWSPHGEHVVGVAGRRLTAVDPLGTVKWTLVRRGVHDPAWSTRDGFAVSYLQDRALRVVDGTGNPATDRGVRGNAAPVTPAWRPHSDSVLTYATLGGAAQTVNVTTRTTLWTAAIPEPIHALAWSRPGRTLVALSSHSLTVLDRAGRVLRTIPLPGAARDFALHPSGARAAVVIGGRVLNVPLSGQPPSPLFQGNVDGLAWSADGRHLLLGWRDTGQWLLLGPGNKIRALHGVSDELGSAGGFPRVAGWCCQG
jgi:hypothetical protein